MLISIYFFYRNIPNYVELSIGKGKQPLTHPANDHSRDVTSKMAVGDVTNINKTDDTCPEQLCSRCTPDVLDDITKDDFKWSRDNFSNTASGYSSLST